MHTQQRRTVHAASQVGGVAPSRHPSRHQPQSTTLTLSGVISGGTATFSDKNTATGKTVTGTSLGPDGHTHATPTYGQHHDYGEHHRVGDHRQRHGSEQDV
jgi:hypothetical protein